MDPVTETLDPPLLLVAMPQVNDPYFRRSVVLLLEHRGEGSFGIIVNRPTDAVVADLLTNIDVPWGGDPSVHAWFGGPVQPSVGFVMFDGGNNRAEVTSVEVGEGVRFTNDGDTIRELAAAPPRRFRLLLGYAGWGEGQLEDELARNDWIIAPFRADLIFSDDSHEIWARTLELIGIRPEALPSWVRPEDGEKAN